MHSIWVKNPFIPIAMPDSVNSFDIFDTLIARRCIEPRNIFLEMERHTGIENFTTLRLRAESEIAARDYSLDDIYVRYAAMTGISAEERDRLKNLEVAFEYINVIPIKSAINQVQDGDLLVSDMYLSATDIRKLLARAGMHTQVGLVVTPHGKRSGKIWPAIQEQFTIERHSGDNLQTDIASASQAGIAVQHLQDAALQPVELWLRQRGFEQLCRLIREIRLAICQQDERLRALELVQILGTLPFLVLSSAFLKDYCATRGVKKVNFCSRDCLNLKSVFDALYVQGLEKTFETHYFYTSRIARLRASKSYVAYFKSLAVSDSVTVDLCGTGWSFGQLMHKAGVQSHLFFVHDLSSNPALIGLYKGIAEYHPPLSRGYIINSPDDKHSFLEVLNYASHGMVMDVTMLGDSGAYCPVFDKPDYPPAIEQFLAITQRVLSFFGEIIPGYIEKGLLAELQANIWQIPDTLLQIYGVLQQQDMLHDIFGPYHGVENNRIMDSLAAFAQQA